MPRLVIYKNTKKFKEVGFSNILTIGRNKNNDIVLEDPEISNFHAAIVEDADGNHILCDQSSRNFTRVGGVKIQQFRLSHGTAFQIVNYFFTFLQDAERKRTEQKVRMNRRIPLQKGAARDSDTVFFWPQATDPAPKFNHASHHRLSLLLSFSNEMVSVRDYNELIEKVLSASIEMIGAQRGFLALLNEQGTLIYTALNGFGGGADSLQVSETMILKVINEGRALLTADAVRDDSFKNVKSVLSYHLKSVMCVPLKLHERIIGCIYLDNPEATGSFVENDLEFFTILARQIAIVIDNARLRKKIEDERNALVDRLRLKDRIVLKSDKEVRLYQEIQRAAVVNIPIMILGETGTGKELVARAVHDFSEREGALKAINCAAIPENLFESELFGYEKGAFTNAVMSKPGIFELAEGGTVFLDEVGDMPPAIQPKLLRVLNEKRVTRLGGTKEIKIDVRVISATNRDLKAMMKEGTFRQDLYFRLSGVVVRTHPIRERKEDIPTLANYFLLRFCEDNDRKVSRISRRAMKMLMSYDWPGNVNELKNVIQRASLFSDGHIINPEDLPEEVHDQASKALKPFPTMAENEKQHIIKALRAAEGNKKKAAELLQIARDTMYKKIEKYGIDDFVP